ncbi:nitronate monooxygenase family protein [Oceanobacillus sp. CFH 90083]|uniref:NAD(P)H-dependent flavin oxidoreductase n=1 Tax=Oceanobacillus sp. CFH 90083 TaxID=2592336 RepID=UPI00128B3B91|nr:nitronate monooxygenase [Oceanobacillus sp. CFH 90083]
MIHNEMTKLLKIKYPIIQAPMAGGITTSKLVTATSNAGGLGMIGAGYMTPVQMQEQIKEIKKLTSKPFGINLFVPSPFQVSEDGIKAANQALNPIRQQLNLPHTDSFSISDHQEVVATFMEQIKVVIEEKVPICSFAFGIPPQDVIAELKQHNITLIGTATTVTEAVENEAAGMDLVVVQGSEAGGHRGGFINPEQEGAVGLMALLPQVVDHIRIPAIAAGGIMDGRGVAASICLGAQGVQMGTAFLTCVESGAHKVHKEAILNINEDQTVLTRAFSGKWARGIKNHFILEMEHHEVFLPDFPVQNTLTQDIRKAAAIQDNPDFMSLWSGQSPRLAKSQKVEALMENIVAEIKQINWNI